MQLPPAIESFDVILRGGIVILLATLAVQVRNLKENFRDLRSDLLPRIERLETSAMQGNDTPEHRSARAAHH